MSERDVLEAVWQRYSRAGSRLWRNNVGLVRDSKGHVIRYGLCPGSSDLVGITPVLITPDMVGQTIGVFTAIETKAPKGRLSKAQVNFLRMVSELGGIAREERG